MSAPVPPESAADWEAPEPRRVLKPPPPLVDWGGQEQRAPDVEDALAQRMAERELSHRGWLALALFIVLVVLSLGLLALTWYQVISGSDHADVVREFVQGVYGPVVTLVGTVVGFYFGARRYPGRRGGD